MSDWFHADVRQLYAKAHRDELYAEAAKARLANRVAHIAPHPLRVWLGNRLISAGEALKRAQYLPPVDAHVVGHR